VPRSTVVGCSTSALVPVPLSEIARGRDLVGHRLGRARRRGHRQPGALALAGIVEPHGGGLDVERGGEGLRRRQRRGLAPGQGARDDAALGQGGAAADQTAGRVQAHDPSGRGGAELVLGRCAPGVVEGEGVEAAVDGGQPGGRIGVGVGGRGPRRRLGGQPHRLGGGPRQHSGLVVGQRGHGREVLGEPQAGRGGDHADPRQQAVERHAPRAHQLAIALAGQEPHPRRRIGALRHHLAGDLRRRLERQLRARHQRERPARALHEQARVGRRVG
jgi:hypothetical protein